MENIIFDSMKLSNIKIFFTVYLTDIIKIYYILHVFRIN